ncbi:hypothetical protein LTR15_002067 [Elasticomyces elasticus]|nr:hypothetical protein LTR15_002067 [Elasticomyces elasticus]
MISSPYAKENPSSVLGLDISCTDGGTDPPVSTELRDNEVHEWFTSYPDNAAPALRVLVLHDQKPAPNSWLSTPRYTEAVVRHAIWRPEAYIDLLPNRGGGCAIFLDDPCCFVLQTPNDDGPACSFALSKHGHVVKGIYTYQSKGHRTSEGAHLFDPVSAMQGEHIQSGWRSTGMQIVVLPQAIAKVHARYIASELGETLDMMSSVEHLISRYNASQITDLAVWGQKLHTCSTRILDLERRARFQAQVFAAIESMTMTHQHYKNKPWPPLAPLKSQLECWTFDFETLPRRIENARSAINSFVQQRNEQLNLSIAQSSRQMTEAALRDNATMKTIAILTMVFLPSTAVATFFSMSMFNWSAESGDRLETKWLWVFFAVAVPLTGLVLAFWYWWARRYEREVSVRFAEESGYDLVPNQVTLESLHGDVEMHDVHIESKIEG